MFQNQIYYLWKNLTLQKIVYFLAYPIIYLLASIPFSFLYVLSDFIRFIIYNLLGYRKKVVRANLRKAFPDKSEKELKWIEQKFYTHFCDITLEAFKTFKMNTSEMQKRMVFKNLSVLTQFERENRSAIIMCGHYSSWEWMMSLGYHMKHKGYGIYTPIRNPHFDNLIRRIRSRHDAFMISISAFMRIILIHTCISDDLFHYLIK